MNFETVYEKVKYETMNICEFEDWLAEVIQKAHDIGYEVGRSDGYSGGYEEAGQSGPFG